MLAIAQDSGSVFNQAPPATAAEVEDAVVAVEGGVAPGDAFGWREAAIREYIALLAEAWEAIDGTTNWHKGSSWYSLDEPPAVDLEFYQGSTSNGIDLVAETIDVISIDPATAVGDPGSPVTLPDEWSIDAAVFGSFVVSSATGSINMYAMALSITVDGVGETILFPIAPIADDDVEFLRSYLTDYGESFGRSEGAAGHPVEDNRLPACPHESDCVRNARQTLLDRLDDPHRISHWRCDCWRGPRRRSSRVS